MKIHINGQPADFEAYSMSYGNDLLDGVLLDMPETYIWLSDHIEEARDIIDQLPDNIEHFDMTGCEIDWEEVPHCWVFSSIERAIVKTAEIVCIEAVE